MKKLIILLMLSFLLQGSSCNDVEILSGNVNNVTDATLMGCDAYAEVSSKDHQCIVLANPYNGVLRVFDVTDNQFLLAPIGFFPLAVQAGITPTYVVSTANNAKQAYVFDAQNNQVLTVSGAYQTNEPSFMSANVSAGLSVVANVNCMAAANLNQQNWLYLATGTDHKIYVYDITTKAQAAREVELPSSAVINDLQLDDTGEKLGIASSQGLNLLDLKTDIFKAVENDNISKVNFGQMTISGQTQSVTLGLSADKNQAYVYLLEQNDPTQSKRFEITVEGLPQAGYLTNDRVFVLTATGELQYLDIQTLVDNPDKIADNLKTIVVADKLGVMPADTSGAVSIIGASGKLFLIYANLIVSVEAQNLENFKRLDGR